MASAERDEASVELSMSPAGAATDNDRLLSWVHGSKDGGDSSEIGLASTLYKTCLQTLGLVSKQYVASKRASRGKKARIIECHSRLCLFGDELLEDGAFEHCLKADHEVREETIRVLYHLGKTLLKGVEGPILHIHDPVRFNEKLVSELTNLVENAYVVSHQSAPGDDELSASEGSESEESEASESECKTTESKKEDDVLGALDTYTTSLMDLRPVLEQSLNDSSQPFTKRAGALPTKFQVTESARPYVLQVHDKYRGAKGALVERLGEANWQRYVRIKAMMAAATTREYPELAVPENVISEIPKSTFRPVSLFHDSGLGTSMPSRSQYAASNASHTSFLSTETEAAKGRLRVPKTPVQVGEGIAFTCFICAQRLSGIRNRIDWKIHVFADLHPYICTFPDCPDLLTTYPTRKLWAEHEFATHRSHQQYECHDCSRTFSEESEFIDHISDDHQYKELNHTQLLATISAAKKSVLKPLSDQACPLCDKTSWTLQRDFVTHLGRHLEEIALSSLPRDAGSESDSDSGSDTDDTNAVLRSPIRGPHYSKLLRLLGDMQNHAASWPFLQPVDRDKVPDDHDVTRRPMDLADIEERLKNGFLTTPEEFIKDATLMFNNYRMYNNETTPYAKGANRLENFMWQQIKKDPEWFGLAPPPTRTRLDSDEYEGIQMLVPCARCRLLHMDCRKSLGNSTTCVGCTKTHVKCSWTDPTKLNDTTIENVIKCICGTTSDVGNTVLCKNCNTRQHIKCYHGDKPVLDVHLCIDCGPKVAKGGQGPPHYSKASLQHGNTHTATASAIPIKHFQSEPQAPWDPFPLVPTPGNTHAATASAMPIDYFQSEPQAPWDYFPLVLPPVNTHAATASAIPIDYFQSEPQAPWDPLRLPPPARHNRAHICREPGCTRTEGFATINDLERHQKSVHKIQPEYSDSKEYKCFGDSCPRRDKEWPRFDNFKQHLKRMHPHESTETLIMRSNEWYERKHAARHDGAHISREPGCTRTEGFATVGDPERHQKSVHKIHSKEYKCFGDSCPRRDKEWPRFDNFKQHLTRMHPHESTETLIMRSNEWYEKHKKLTARPEARFAFTAGFGPKRRTDESAFFDAGFMESAPGSSR